MHCGSFAWVAVDVGCEFPGDVSWTACVWTLPVAGTSLCMEAGFQEQVSQATESESCLLSLDPEIGTALPPTFSVGHRHIIS